MKEYNYARQIGEFHARAQSKHHKLKENKRIYPRTNPNVSTYLMLLLILSPHLLPLVSANTFENTDRPKLSKNKPVVVPHPLLPAGPMYTEYETYLLPDGLDCENKALGKNQGKKCKLTDDLYFMKAIATTEEEERLALDDKKKDKKQKSNPLRAIYFFKLLKIISPRIKVPELTFFYQKEITKEEGGTFYYGSKFLPDFNSAALVRKNMENQGMHFSTINKNMRGEVEKYIGKHNIPYLMVASTFIYDLAKNWENWGFDNKQNLIFIDVDFPVYTLDLHFKYALNSINEFGKRGLYLGIDDIARMKKIYESMLAKEPPSSVHDSVDLTLADYKTLLTSFIKGCDLTIMRMKNDKNPSIKIHDSWIEGVRIAWGLAREAEKSTQHNFIAKR